MKELRTSLGLEFNDLVIVTVYATNLIGDGPQCVPNTSGVYI
jgi:hypothetical protein